MSDPQRLAPTPESIAADITAAFDGVVVASMPGATFFSLDESNWPNFATLVWTDDFDQASNLSREGVFRLNVGLTRPTFERLVGSMPDPDFTALDVLLPHPVYAAQHWVSILSPSEASYRQLAWPLIVEAHDRLAAQRARRADRAGA